MQTGEGLLHELYYQPGGADGRIHCPAGLVPAPGQYVLTAAVSAEGGSDASTAVPLFLTQRTSEGFDFSAAVPTGWRPGTRLALRGPLGHGFHVPPEARRAALVALDGSPARLTALLPGLLGRGAAVTVVCEPPFPDLPEAVEVQPPGSLEEVCRWADFIAAEPGRERLPALRRRLTGGLAVPALVLVRAPMPCGALADCGVCAVTVRGRWKLACKDGPVFNLREVGEG